MKRTLLSVAAIGFAITSIASCSDKSATAPDGVVAANGSTDAYRSVSTVSVSVAPTSVVVGDSARATAVLRDYRGRIVTGTVTWSTSASSVATISATGVVRGAGAGSASIKATRGSKTGSATLTVTNLVSVAPVSTVAVSLASSTITPGQTTQATATTRDSSNNVLTGRVITWSSGNTAVSTVSASGLVTAVTAGATAITALSETKAGNSTITVSAPAPVPVASVSVSPATPSIQVGSTAQLSAITRDANNNVLTGRVITWSSGNTAVSTVSASGLVTAVSAGSATITALSETRAGTSAITVTAVAPVPVASVSVSPGTPSIQVGSTVQLSATARDANNNILTGRSIAWSTANAAIASISTTGLVTAVTAGSTQITATSEGKTGSAAVTVTAVPPPPPTGTNEPTGMTVLTERPFSALNENGWTNTGGSSYAIVADASAPKSPSSVGQIKFPAGFGSGNAPVVLEKAWSSTNKTLYVSFWVKFSSNWDGNDSGVNKIFHFWIGGSNRLVLNARGVGSGRLLTEVELQGIKAGGNYDAGTTALFTGNLGASGELVRNQWLHWEAVFVGNTSGAANGTVDWWADGVKIGHYSGLQFVAGAGLWEELEWSPTYGGFGAPVPADQYQWIDHLYISGKSN